MTFLEMMEKEILSAGNFFTTKESFNLIEEDSTFS